MKVLREELNGVLVLEPKVFGDDRGFFFESWNQNGFNALVGRPVAFVQDNHSSSVRGVLRGLHYQVAQTQGKLVRVISGEVFDVAVDMRRSSPTFGKWAGEVLSGENRRMMWIPEGFAHGFVVLSERAVFTYLCTRPYDPVADAGIRWNDARIGVDWPESAPSLSGKDAIAPFLDDIDPARLPEYLA
jgi:dTDP-4-dehydrorhamnose 3,5-epimerase